MKPKDLLQSDMSRFSNALADVVRDVTRLTNVICEIGGKGVDISGSRYGITIHGFCSKPGEESTDIFFTEHINADGFVTQYSMDIGGFDL